MGHNKLSLLTAYNSALNYDLISLTETYNSTADLNNLYINGYNLLRADYPMLKAERGGFFLYYRKNSTLQLVDTP